MNERRDRRLVPDTGPWWALPNRRGIPVELCAGDGVPIGVEAIDQVEWLLDEAGDGIVQVALSPDLHRGATVPIGTTVLTEGVVHPALVGTDIGCGMRLEVTDLEEGEVRSALDRIEQRARALFFEGGRDLPLRPAERRAALEAGAVGLLGTLDHREGTWARLTDDDLVDAGTRDNDGGWLGEGDPGPFADWVDGSRPGLSYDTQIGSAGGGNHFAAELQVVAEVDDGATAHSWGLRRGQVVVMSHSGSLGFGQRAAATGRRVAETAWPEGRRRPDLVPIAGDDPALVHWLGSLHAAANFARVNRLALSLVARRVLADAVRPCRSRVLWDACHNLVWEEPGGRWLHRKGATPATKVAPSALATATGPMAPDGGRPVLVPGSMGSSSWILAGLGNVRALGSASHGAGRRVARGRARAVDGDRLDRFLEEFRIITPFDPGSPAARPDVTARWRAAIAEEAPWRYKEPQAVVRSLAAGGVARPVARLEPICTVKS